MIFDYDVMFISTGNVTKSGFSSSIKIRGTNLNGMTARVSIPSSTGTNAKLYPEIWGSDDDSTYQHLASYEGSPISFVTGGKEVIIPFATTFDYVKLYMKMTGATTGQSFGAVKAGIVTNVAHDYDRSWTYDVDE